MMFKNAPSILCLPLLGAPAVQGVAAPAPLASLTLSAEDGYLVDVEVNGRPLRLRVETGHSGVILNPSAAARAGLTGSLVSSVALIGSVRIPGETSVAPLRIGDWQGKRRFTWYTRDVEPNVDGIISIAQLPYERVTLRLRPERQGERPLLIETREQASSDLTYIHRLSGRSIAVRFSAHLPFSFATASAAALLANHHGGTWSGLPFQRTIYLDVARPLRPMAFARPVTLGGLSLAELFVRTTDYRGRYVLPADAPQDPSELMVTAQNGRGKPMLAIMIGADRLAKCSSMSFEKSTRLLTLSCL